MNPLEMAFPALASGNYAVTSPAVSDYNCIAWAAGESDRWWWPDPLGLNFWPPEIPRLETIDSFRLAFEALGFAKAKNDQPEPGMEKIAIFAQGGKPTHMARQLENGRWTSKMGQSEDIEHALRDLEGVLYGEVALFMGRPKSGATPLAKGP
ncbi:MAG: hypothetical protein LW700_12280 [Gemmataceae bacterium]|jgi:hypothetical protein|nr:hypothetical protein [Gemmataceae bacterium]